jgi:hypothetical protein
VENVINNAMKIITVDLIIFRLNARNRNGTVAKANIEGSALSPFNLWIVNPKIVIVGV